MPSTMSILKMDILKRPQKPPPNPISVHIKSEIRKISLIGICFGPWIRRWIVWTSPGVLILGPADENSGGSPG